MRGRDRERGKENIYIPSWSKETSVIKPLANGSLFFVQTMSAPVMLVEQMRAVSSAPRMAYCTGGA